MITTHLISHISCDYENCLEEYEIIQSMSNDSITLLDFKKYRLDEMIEEIKFRLNAKKWYLGENNYCPKHYPSREIICHIVQDHSVYGKWWKVFDINHNTIYEAPRIKDIRHLSKNGKIHRGINNKYVSNVVRELYLSGFYNIYWFEGFN